MMGASGEFDVLGNARWRWSGTHRDDVVVSEEG